MADNNLRARMIELVRDEFAFEVRSVGLDLMDLANKLEFEFEGEDEPTAVIPNAEELFAFEWINARERD